MNYKRNKDIIFTYKIDLLVSGFICLNWNNFEEKF